MYLIRHCIGLEAFLFELPDRHNTSRQFLRNLDKEIFTY